MHDLRLQEQSDDASLRRLLAQFTERLDRRDYTASTELLADPVVLDLRPYASGWALRPFANRERADRLEAVLSSFSSHEHRVSSPRFTVDGKSALGMAHARIRLSRRHEELAIYADLACRFVHHDERWLIQRLDFTVVRQEGNRAVRL